MNELQRLQPEESRRVYDVVSDAGIDVTDWAEIAGGLARAASNPKYCYEWAFVEPGRVVALSIWYRNLQTQGGSIVMFGNFRAVADQFAQAGGSPVSVRRALRADEAVQVAVSEKLPVRAVICDGRMREEWGPQATPSQVQRRSLDPVPWAVTAYEHASGAFNLTRGALPHRLTDQFSAADASDESQVEKKTVTGDQFVRDPTVRQRVLSRASGRCELCKEYGFATDRGEVFLETHHVVPLSEGGPDNVENVAALCPNHHREAHYGAKRRSIRAELLAKLQQQLG